MSADSPNFPDPDESHDAAEQTSSKPGAKRRASRAGTRSVASLTPEQLARKRANDREAQRSIRQRTKNHIEDLEKRIRELSGEEEAQSLEDVRRRNVELEEELKYLRETLARSEGSVASSPELAPLSTRYGMEMIDSPYSYSPQWSSSPCTVSSAGELITSFAPDYSSLDYGFSEPGSARSDTFSPPIGMEMTTTPPQVAPAVNRRGALFDPRPHFGRSRSYPHGRLGQPTTQPGQPWQPSPPAMVPSRLSMNGNMMGMPSPPGMGQPMSLTSNPAGLNGNMVGMAQSPPTSHPNPNMAAINHSPSTSHPAMAIGMGPSSSTKHYQMAPTSNPLGIDGGMTGGPSNVQRQTQPGMGMNGTMPDIASPISRQSPLSSSGMGDGQAMQMQDQWTIFETEEGVEETHGNWRMMMR